MRLHERRTPFDARLIPQPSREHLHSIRNTPVTNAGQREPRFRTRSYALHVLRKLALIVVCIVVLAACDFAGLSEQDGGFLEPSDATNAIGPTRYIELVNAAYGIYDRNGHLIESGAAGAMYGTGSAFVSDPQGPVRVVGCRPAHGSVS